MNKDQTFPQNEVEGFAKKFAKYSFNTLICGLGLLFILYASKIYCDSWSFANALVYFVGFFGIPVLLLVLCWKIKAVRYQLLVCVIILAIWLPYSYGFTRVYKNDFSAYLANETAFSEKAAEYMPSSNAISNTQVISYEEQNTLNGNFKLIKLTVAYEDEMFQTEKENLKKRYQANLKEYHYDDFYLDGERFYCFAIPDDKVSYAMAYHTCSDEGTITYLFFQNKHGLFGWRAGVELGAYFGYDRVIAIENTIEETS